MSTKEIQQALKRIGWPIADDGVWGDHTTDALRDFQRGYALTPLDASGKPGPKTNHALRECVANGGHCSEHFTFKEFASKGNGWIKVDRALVHGLERYRKALGGAVEIISAYRDPAHNAAVGGKSQSQHLYGNAADIPAVMPTAKVAALGIFSGIGYQHQTGLVRHVDVRHVGPNTTGGTLANPTEWVYE
jgi:zinc D-Ala-D-Ala carboxypeptidase